VGQRRFAACCVLAQLSTNSPTTFFARIHDFFDLIWGPLWGGGERVRLAGARALSACLSVLRDRTYHLDWYCFLYDQLMDGFIQGSEEAVHGSLLVAREALRYTGDFMIPRFKEVCRCIMLLKVRSSYLL
jgi:FKBP12-rapamycin complex-associated protein